VTILEVDLERMRFLDITLHTAHMLYSNEAHLMSLLPTVDLLIGAVLVPGAKAPKLIRREMLRRMRPGSVLVDIAIDQGGCAETTRPTTHREASRSRLLRPRDLRRDGSVDTERTMLPGHPSPGEILANDGDHPSIWGDYRLGQIAERILFATTLEEKLQCPSVIADEQLGPPLATPKAPGRPKELQFKVTGEARDSFGKAVKLDPKNANAWNGLGWASTVTMGRLIAPCRDHASI
jgi:hypothetical protein